MGLGIFFPLYKCNSYSMYIERIKCPQIDINIYKQHLNIFMRPGIFFIGLLTLIFLGIWSCRDDDNFDTGNIVLDFSADTLRFDTVFTTLGSATRSLIVRNPSSENILISEIGLTSGDASIFRMNVDGISTTSAEDILIRGGDSLWVFVEVTIDPDSPISDSPFIINEEISFLINDSEQRVVLEAWGQNANYIPRAYNSGNIALLSCDMQEISWSDPKPYVIWGILIIDSCTVNIPEGTRVHIHGGVADNDQLGVLNDGIVAVFPRGRIVARGTKDNPVRIETDRLEPEFADLPGQWAGMIFTAGSRGNVFEHTHIKNAITAVRVDSTAQLTLNNSIISNVSGIALAGIRADISADNCLFHSSGSNTLSLSYGGNYDFTYCTIANFNSNQSVVSLSNAQCLDPLCSQLRPFRLIANFTNSIVFGSLSDVISLFDYSLGGDPSAFQYSFDHCIVKERDLTDNFPDFFEPGNCDPCITATNSDALFEDAAEQNYRLDTLSIAEEMAIPISGINTDLEGNIRDSNNPDIGCYEYGF
jgi:hypothetical protein